MNKEREAFETLWTDGNGHFKFFEFDQDACKYRLNGVTDNLSKEDLLSASITLNTAWLFWLGAKKRAVPEGFVLMPKKPDVDKAWSIALKRIVPPPKTNDAIQKELLYKKYVDDLYSEQDRILLDYEAMIEAQESVG